MSPITCWTWWWPLSRSKHVVRLTSFITDQLVFWLPYTTPFIGVTVSPVSRAWHCVTLQLLTVLTTLHTRLIVIGLVSHISQHITQYQYHLVQLPVLRATCCRCMWLGAVFWQHFCLPLLTREWAEFCCTTSQLLKLFHDLRLVSASDSGALFPCVCVCTLKEFILTLLLGFGP